MLLLTDGSANDLGVGVYITITHDSPVPNNLKNHKPFTKPLLCSKQKSVRCHCHWSACTVGPNVAFFIDGQAAIVLLKVTLLNPRSYMNTNHRYQIFKKIACSIIFVPGHHCITGNGQADILANAAAKQELVCLEPSLPVSICIVKKELRAHAE